MGVFIGRSIANFSIESKREYYKATTESFLFLYDNPYHNREQPARVKINVGDRIDVLKKVNFNRPGKGKITKDTIVKDEFGIKKYRLKNGDVLEAVRCNYRINHEDEKVFYVRLGSVKDEHGNPQYAYLDHKSFTPFLDGEWWYIKTQDNKTGWFFPLSSSVQFSPGKERSFDEKTKAGFPIYFKENSNYILIDEDNNCGWYLDKSSIKCEVDSKSVNIWVDVIMVNDANNGNRELNKREKHCFSFNEYKGIAAPVSPSSTTPILAIDSFKYKDNRKNTMVVHPAAAMSYYIVTEKIWEQFEFDNDFYSRADL